MMPGVPWPKNAAAMALPDAITGRVENAAARWGGSHGCWNDQEILILGWAREAWMRNHRTLLGPESGPVVVDKCAEGEVPRGLSCEVVWGKSLISPR